MYGADAGERDQNPRAMIDVDEADNLFVAFSGEDGVYREYPGGENPLWDAGITVAKFDSQGSLEWVQPSTAIITDVAVVDGDAWVVAFAVETDITIAGQSFELRSGHETFTAVARLSGTDGAVLEHFQLDHLEWRGFGTEPFFVHDDQNLWLVSRAFDIRHDDTTWAPPSTAYSSFVYPIGGPPLWLPGIVANAVQDSSGNLVVSVSTPSNSTYTFGGETFTSNGWGVARYTPTLLHELSFVGLYTGQLVAGLDTFLFVQTFGGEFFQRVDDTGTVLQSIGGAAVPFAGHPGRARDERIYMAGSGPGSNTTYAGRTFPGGYPAMLTVFDAVSLELEQAVAFDLDVIGADANGGVDDFAFVDDGASVVLSGTWERGLSIGDESVDLGRQYRGLALVKVKVDQP
jgi:hypothetical protein